MGNQLSKILNSDLIGKLFLLALIAIAFSIRFYVASLDPFLHPWDERFHALVAKNMMEFPFRPMLYENPLAPFKIEEWCCNHIWLHKQPLFLWQMAVSMKIFGINELAIRLPSVAMGALLVLFAYDITHFWTRDKWVAFVSATFFCFLNYQIAMISGRRSLDHNDLTFVFYISASIWAMTKYFSSARKGKWIIVAGMLIGCAVMVKWLTAFLVFGGWFVYILCNSETRKQKEYYLDLIKALFVSLIVFLPWQIYTYTTFPNEYLASQAYNWKHITQVLGKHSGDLFFYFRKAHLLYHPSLWMPIIVGIPIALFFKKYDRSFSISALAMILVLYGFFSVVVKTKMIAYVYPVCILIIPFCAMTITQICTGVSRIAGSKKVFLKTPLIVASVAVLSHFSLQWKDIKSFRSPDNKVWADLVANANLYRNADVIIPENSVLLNLDNFETINFMFYQDILTVHWFPLEEYYYEIKENGYEVYCFEENKYRVPWYIVSDPDVHWITRNDFN